MLIDGSECLEYQQEGTRGSWECLSRAWAGVTILTYIQNKRLAHFRIVPFCRKLIFIAFVEYFVVDEDGQEDVEIK